MDPKMVLTEAADAFGVTPQFFHQALKRRNLPFQKKNNKVYFYHGTSKLLFGQEFKSQIISVQIVKGGAGKTTLCLSIGIRSSLYGAKTLIIDLDQQGNLTMACGINAHDHPVMIEIINREIPIKNAIIPLNEGLHILPSRIENSLLDNHLMLNRLPLDRIYKDMLLPLKKEYDLILIDCPPALSSSVVAATLASDSVISPVTPSEFSVEGLQLTTREIGRIEKDFKTKIETRTVINEFDVRNSLSQEIMQYLMTSPVYGNKLFRSFIRKCQEFENVLAKKISIYDALSYSTAKEDVDLLTRELLQIGRLTEDKKNIEAHDTEISA
jgi:chromosome partitioning protein